MVKRGNSIPYWPLCTFPEIIICTEFPGRGCVCTELLNIELEFCCSRNRPSPTDPEAKGTRSQPETTSWWFGSAVSLFSCVQPLVVGMRLPSCDPCPDCPEPCSPSASAVLLCAAAQPNRYLGHLISQLLCCRKGRGWSAGQQPCQQQASRGRD